MLQPFDLARFLIARTFPFERETREEPSRRMRTPQISQDSPLAHALRSILFIAEWLRAAMLDEPAAKRAYFA
ncbi:hypothetical protein B1812_12660 [Methylocystis bryophila]|uniref:Uncharacterized protein n=1 Tax=Methylocystis bryophila TaxID=655015 RepID=A0A1W6MW07_9HYPH|nr:hypothetical protein B1812_12660 [Methylocystis bryophila]